MKHLRIFESFGDDEDLEDALEGYLQCALWTEELDSDYDVDDFDTLSVDLARDDVEKFLEELDDYDLLDELLNQMDYNSIGHDFWLTRNGHGAGFWDRDIEELGNEITKICSEFGTKYVYEENGKIYME